MRFNRQAVPVAVVVLIAAGLALALLGFGLQRSLARGRSR